MKWNWQPWMASAVVGLGSSFLITMADPSTSSWIQLTHFAFWQKVVILMITHAGLAQTNFRSPNTRTRSEDSQPLRLDLFDDRRKGGDK